MARLFSGGPLVIASHNPGKIREIRDLLLPFGAEILAAAELDLPEPAETGRSFVANAEIKALAAATVSGHPALADDSGLVVAALRNQPGIYSARWAGPEKDFAKAMAEVETRLSGIIDRRGHFACALALAWPDGHVETFEGTVYGHLVWPPRGDRGFGYDPMFVPNGYDVTFGEMAPELKHRISHRAEAFRKLVDGCFRQPAPA
ncbi:MAG: RdgB/HAM1 family non-canonical purine NTP pyrophosphatase [Rhodospirillales bacterium]|nr:MAG: RdgB/HAM1 family non-canonical purine NTP pyrophosphatase [Rhodospirillales bacterium]